MAAPKAVEVVSPNAGALARQEFGASQLEVRSETASSAMAAYAQTTVQARFIMAERKPRDLARARARILEACKRPRFADEAIYNKPVGDGIEGPSIRLAEALVRELGNIDVDVTTIVEDDMKRMLSIVATDLESNATYRDSVVINKTVERHSDKGAEVIGQRTNKYGKTVYIVKATEDELLNKQGAVVSKKIRTATLRLVPADILEEAMEQCRLTLEAETINDLPGVRKRVVAGFAALKPPVSPEDLSKYLGKDLAQAKPLEVLELRKLGLAIRDGEATWKEALDAKIAQRATKPEAVKTETPGPTPPPSAASTKGETAEEQEPAAQSTAPAGFDAVTGVVEELDPNSPEGVGAKYEREIAAATDLRQLAEIADRFRKANLPLDVQQKVTVTYIRVKKAIEAKAKEARS